MRNYYYPDNSCYLSYSKVNIQFICLLVYRMPFQKAQITGIELDESVNRFLNTKTTSTAKAYRVCLRRFRYFYDKPFSDFIDEIEKQTEANKGLPLSQRIRPGEEAIRGFIEWHIEQRYSPNTVRQSVAALQNALKYYGISISTQFIELPPNRPLRENEKHRWTLEEVKSFVDAADYLRDKAFILVAFQSGLSVSDIVALNYGDIKREFEENKLPLIIHTYRKKTGNEIKTFLGRDAVHYLQLYLNSRPNIQPRDPLFTKLGTNKRVTDGALQKQLKLYADKMDFLFEEQVNNGFNPARPHSLRSAFRSRLTGKMNDTLIEFFMGHSIGEQVKTYINMPDDELRELYANYEHLLAIEKTSKDEIANKSKTAIPEAAMKQIREQGQRIAELETKLNTVSDQLLNLEKKISLQLQGFEAALKAQAK